MPPSEAPETPSEAPQPFSKARDPKVIEANLRILIKAVEQSPVSVIITDTKGLIQYVNPKFTQLMGYTPEETVGKTPRIIKGGFQTREFYQDMWDQLLSGKEWHGVFHNRTKAGTLVWEMGSISPIRDEDGAVTHFVGVKEDITELKSLQEQLEHMARHDQLTGLPNRFLFNDRLQQLLVQAKRRRARFALLFLDLDQFKQVNDTLGHEAGDQVLAETARRLTVCVRESDTVSRMGGDEFTILLGDVHGEADVKGIAEALATALIRPFQVGEVACTVGVSIGIALYPEDGQTMDELLSRADTAMYLVKKRGRNGHRFASEGLD